MKALNNCIISVLLSEQTTLVKFLHKKTYPHAHVAIFEQYLYEPHAFYYCGLIFLTLLFQEHMFKDILFSQERISHGLNYTARALASTIHK